MLFWDVSLNKRKMDILRALEGAGFFRFPAEEGMIAGHHLLRAYKGSYFKLLRQAVLALCPPETVQWILDQAERSWRSSKDKVRRLIWLRHIASDRQALSEGFVVAAGILPSLDPNWKEPPRVGYMQAHDVTPCVTCQLWIREYIFLLRERKEAALDAMIARDEEERRSKEEANRV
jgi:hypothetical protein